MPVCLQCLFFLGGNKYEYAFGEKTNCTNPTIHKYTCSHLLPEHWFPGTNTNCGVFRHWVFQVPKYHLVPEYKVETTLYPGVDAVPEF